MGSVFYLDDKWQSTFGTFTCTSTGGPATTVSWRRDGTTLSDGNNYSITSQVTDAETATYTQHTDSDWETGGRVSVQCVQHQDIFRKY